MKKKLIATTLAVLLTMSMMAIFASAGATVSVTVTHPVIPLIGNYDCKADGVVTNQTGLQVTSQIRQGSQVIEADTKSKSNATSLSVTTHSSYSSNPTSGFGRTISSPSNPKQASKANPFK